MAKGDVMKRPAAKVKAKAKAKAKAAKAVLKRPASLPGKSKTEYILVSAYTLQLGHVMSPSVEDAKGISVYRREHRGDGSFGNLVFHWSCSDFPCPTYMCSNSERTRIYAVSEVPEEGTVSAYSFDARTGQLKLLNSMLTGGSIACHVSLTRNERTLAVANYGGSVALFQLSAEGKLSQRSDLQLAESLGVGVNKERQEGPHPHMAHFDAANKHLLVPDLGLDRVMTYQVQGEKNLRLRGHMAVAPGSGPRHLVFHPTLSVVYVLNELLSTVLACHYDASSGELLPTDPVATVPGAVVGLEGQTFAAAIRISGDGKFLYVSNRGHDSITVLRVLEDGLVEHLEPVALCSTSVDDGQHGGRMVAQWPPRECPRDFALCCKDQYLIVGNQDSDSLVVLERNPELGTLSKIGVSVSCSAPACILPLF